MQKPDDYRVETFVASVPNPPWEVRVLHLPTGTARTACGRGYGYRRAAWELREEIASVVADGLAGAVTPGRSGVA